MLAGGTYIFGGDVHAVAFVDCIAVLKVLWYCYTHATARNIEINWLIKAAGVMLHMLIEHVFARNANMCCPILHIGGHIGGPHNYNLQTVQTSRQNQFARGFWVF